MAGTLPLVDLSRGLRRWWTKEGGLQDKINGIITFCNQLSADIDTLVAGAITNELVFSVNTQSAADNAVLASVAQVQQLTMTTSGKSFTLPDMTANGYDGLQITIKNAGAEAFGLKDNSGAYLITSLAPGQIAIIALVDSLTAAGNWQAVALPPSVILDGAAANDFLQYDGTKLVNVTPAEVITALGLDDAALTSSENEWAEVQNFGEVALTDGANIAWNAKTQPCARVTIGGNRTVDNPSNLRAGAVYILRVIQDATGGRTLTFGSAFKWENGIAIQPAASANSITVYSFYCDGSTLTGSALQGVS